mgnify:CR=1 FL=1
MSVFESRLQVVEEIIEGVATQGGRVVQDPDTQQLRVNDEFTVSVVLARCQATAAGSLRWPWPSASPKTDKAPNRNPETQRS